MLLLRKIIEKKLKTFVNKILNKFGYQIKKKDNGFTFNPNLNWLKEYNIKTIFDIGANEGQFAVFANSVLPDSIIFSYEPISECYNELVKLQKKIPKLHPFNFALGNVNDNLEFYKNEFSPSSSLLTMSDEHVKNFPLTGNQQVEMINVKRLDDISNSLHFKENILVKIDVQGYELNVITGGEMFFTHKPLIVIIESSFVQLYENEPSFDDIYKKMLSLGYVYRGNLNQLYSPIDGSVLQGDAIFMKNNIN